MQRILAVEGINVVCRRRLNPVAFCAAVSDRRGHGRPGGLRSFGRGRNLVLWTAKSGLLHGVSAWQARTRARWPPR